MSTSQPSRGKTSFESTSGSFAPKANSAPSEAAALAPAPGSVEMVQTQLQRLKPGHRVVVDGREQLIVDVDAAPDPGGWLYYDVTTYDPERRQITTTTFNSFEGIPSVPASAAISDADYLTVHRPQQVVAARRKAQSAAVAADLGTRKWHPFEARRLRREAEQATVRLAQVEALARHNGVLA